MSKCIFLYSASNDMSLAICCYLKILSPPSWGGYGEGGYSNNIFPEVPPKSDKHPHKRQFSIYYSFTVINVVTFEMNTLYIYIYTKFSFKKLLSTLLNLDINYNLLVWALWLFTKHMEK